MSRKPKSKKKRPSATKKIHIGRVTVFFRGASWHLYYRDSGKPIRVRIGRDRAEAERRAAEVNAQLAHGAPTAYGFERIAVERLIGRWLEHHELVQRSSVATVRRYRTATNHLLRFLHELHPRLTVDALTGRIAEDFVKFLRRSRISPNGHPKTRKRPLRDKGLIFILSACRSLLNYAARQRNLPPYAHNAFAELRIERMRIEDAKPTEILTPQEEAAFFAACDTWQVGVFFALGFTGMRPGELCHLLVEDVNLAGHTLHIRNHPELGWRTKTRSERKVYLFPELEALLQQAMDGRRCGPLFLARRYAGGEGQPPLAGMDAGALAAQLDVRIQEDVDRTGENLQRAAVAKTARRLWLDMGAITPKQVRSEFINVARRIGRPDLTCPKLWRHQMATVMQAADVDIFVRREIIGHTNLATTAMYTHTQDETRLREMNKTLPLRKGSLEVIREKFGTVA